MENIIEIQELTKYYGKNLGVENVSLDLKKGEIFGFIGPNGAGKSTTIRSIMNLINKTNGRVLIEGKEFLKYFSAFTLADIRNVIVDVAINPLIILISIGLTMAFTVATLINYENKDLV